MKKQTLASVLALGTMAATANAALWVDFSNGFNQDGVAHNEPGYSVYDEDHEDRATTDPDGWHTETFATSFANSGAASVAFTPDWPNTDDINVEQMIDRAASNDNQWLGSGIDLLTDWIGIDTRSGNGDWDGTTGTPTYLTFTLVGLPADTYSYTSFHHDTENVWADYTVEISTDGGGSFSSPITGAMTSSSTGGNPDNPTDTTTGDPLTLASTFNGGFTSDGSDVVIRYAALADTQVHRRLLGVNGFQLEQVPEPSTGLLGLLGVALIGLRRRR